MNYAASALPPKTLTDDERARLLKVTGHRAEDFRDHVWLSVALGSGLRESELLGLDVGDVFDNEGQSKRRVQLRVYKRSNDDPSSQQVVLPDALRAKLDRFHKWKRLRNESLAPDAPLFVSRLGRRLSRRQLRHRFREWQTRAGLERRLPFHATRHTALTLIYRRTRDLRLVQRAARHKSIVSTSIYTHVGDQQLLDALRDQPC